MVDGLDPNAGDVRHPGDYIEDEMIPYINKALSGETVYSQNMLDCLYIECPPLSTKSAGAASLYICLIYLISCHT